MREALALGTDKKTSGFALEMEAVSGLKLPSSLVPPIIAGGQHVAAALQYMESADYIQDRHFVASWLQKSRPRRILDLGGKSQPLEQILLLSADWCPELILTLDFAADGRMQKLPCAQSGISDSVSVVHVPATVEEALEHVEMKRIHFDAIVCLGCGAPWWGAGSPRQALEAFKRPYKLFVGFAGSGSKDASVFADLPTASGARIITERYSAGSAGLSHDTERRLQVIEYQFPSQF
jgi:hypothetical protein